MKSIGGALVFLGAGSFVLHFLEREFRLLAWVDNWGPTVGNGIRIGMIVVGIALYLIGNKQEQAKAGN
jgi:hypothetical protein